MEKIKMSFNNWINNLQYTYIVKYSLIIKRNEVPGNTKTQMILKCTLSERNQFAEATYYMISMI